MRRTKRKADIPAEIQDAQRQFAAWRERKTGGARIPGELWGLAASLVGSFGISMVASALSVNHTVLKRRVEASAGSIVPAVPVQTFVEVQAAPRDARACEPGFVVELRRADGSSMSIQSSFDGVDVAGLVSAFVGAPCLQ